MQRNAYLDNLKFVLMFLVVLGHCLENSGLENALVFMIYVFHMPAFVFLAGATSKNDGIARQIRPIVVIYLVFQVAYAAVLIAGRRASFDLVVTPYYVLWFLLALVWWKLSLPVTSKSSLWLAITIVTAVVGGFIPFIGRVMTLSRTLVWFPFFLAGFFYGKRVLAMLEKLAVWARVTGALVVTGSYLVCTYLTVPHSMLYESYPYKRAGTGVLFRLEHIVAAALLIPAVCILVPRSKSWITKYGQCTLAILVLHPVFMILLHPVLLRRHSVTLSVVVSVLITALCGHPKLESLVRKVGRLGETRETRLLRQEPA